MSAKRHKNRPQAIDLKTLLEARATPSVTAQGNSGPGSAHGGPGTGTDATGIALHHFALSVSLEAPYLVHGNDPGRLGLDATLLTDAGGRPVLPGTLLAGRIAEVWVAHGRDLGGADADEWFGRAGIDPEIDQGRRARLRTADLVLTLMDQREFDGAALRAPRAEFDVSRVRIDPDTGSVEAGALLVAEQVCLPGTAMRFEGTWSAWATAAEAALLRRQLHAALLLQTQLGAWRSIGFGRVLAVGVEVRLAQPMSSATAVKRVDVSASPAGARRRYSLSTGDALCIAARSRRNNVFESQDYFTGATLLGAIARMLCDQHGVGAVTELREHSALARHFDRLRCTHALPATVDGARPMPLPQSLVDIGGGELKDAWPCAQPPAGLNNPIAFATDWKPVTFEAVAKAQGWGGTRTHLRVRTDINVEGQAKEGALFAYECRVAERDNLGAVKTRWLFDLDVGAIEPGEHNAVWQALDALLAWGLAPLGKTDACAAVTRLEQDDPGAGAVWPSMDLDRLEAGQLLPVQLVSDALLIATPAIAERSHVDLLALYQGAFDDLQAQARDRLGLAADSSPPLHLRHHFARQRLAGGTWWHGRGARTRPAYQPLVLTEAGAVFVLEVGADVKAAREVLRMWQAEGLPLPGAVAAAHGNTWRDHPYRPENGYGEIAVQPAHPWPVL